MTQTRKFLTAAAVLSALAITGSPAFGSPTGTDVPVAQGAKKKKKDKSKSKNKGNDTKLRAKLEECTADGATFTGSMPARGSGLRMEMRFDLQERRKVGRRSRWVIVNNVPSFGVWDTADAGVPGFIVRKRVGGLDAGSKLRAVIRFRWVKPNGKRARGAKRVTRTCSVPENRPDLRARFPSVQRAAGDQPWTYRALIQNTRAGAAGAFDVALVLGDDTAPVIQRVTGVAPGGRVAVQITAPRCVPGTAVRFIVDYKDEVAESREDNNVLTRRCAGQR